MTELEYRIQTIHQADSKTLAIESVRAYRAGAYRAAIAAIWVAVVTDIRQKIEDLSESDGEAKKWSDTYANAKSDMESLRPSYAKMQQLEDGIIDFAFTKLELLTARECTELNRLRQDRNLSVHPNSLGSGEIFTPTPELARLHIITAIDAVLSQGTKVGRSLITLLEKEMSADSWPKAPGDLDYFIERYFLPARISTRSALASVMIKNSFKASDLSNRTIGRCRRAVIAIAISAPELFEERLRLELEKAERRGLNDDELQRCVGAFGFSGCFMDTLPTSALSRLRALISRTAVDDLVENRFFAGGIPDSPELKDLFLERLGTLSHHHLERIVHQTPDREFLIKPAIDLVAKTENFAEAEEHLSTLATLGPMIRPEHLDKLKNAIMNNQGDQVRPARGVDECLLEMFAHCDQGNPELLEAWKDLSTELHKASTGSAPFYGRGDHRYADLVGAVDAAIT